MRAWIVRTVPRYRFPLILVANALVTLIALVVFNALRPLPPALTQRDIDRAVGRSLQTLPPAPSWQSVAYQVIRPSLVIIQAELSGTGPGARSSIGTGVVIQDTGVILTCLHVVQNADQVKVVFADGSDADALVTVREPDKDLAVLTAMRVPDELQPAVLASSASLHPGDEVMAVGTPFGIPDSVSSGVVSGLGREYTSRDTGVTLKDLIQFDAAVNPGNSGGPLLNKAGQVVGIVTGLANPTDQSVFIGIGFAVPIDTAASAAGSPPF